MLPSVRRFGRHLAGMIDRRLIAGIALSAVGLGSIVGYEGWSGTAEQPLPGDKLTIGFGHTGADVKPGATITPPAAIKVAIRDVAVTEAGLKRCIKAPLFQHEYDAYVSLGINVGTPAVCESSIPEKLNTGDYAAACKTILDFDKFRDRTKPKVQDPVTGKWDHPLVRIRGLTIRRQAEYRQCMGEGVVP